MTLYLTSDEKYINSINSRTKFSNNILPDFFQDNSFNLSLKEVYFDPKFPTLADLKCPHVITTVFPKNHKLIEFSSEIQQMSMFKNMFTNNKLSNRPRDVAPLIFQRNFPQNDADIKNLDSTVMYEIHPSMGFVFSIAYCNDININSRNGIVNFLNSTMFPLHAKKPIQYLPSGMVKIESDLNMYMSEGILKLLGINQYEIEGKSVPMINFPDSDMIREKYPIIDDNGDVKPYADMLAKIEDTSQIYSNYRKLVTDNPKGEMIIEYSAGSGLNKQMFKLEQDFDLNMFHSNSHLFDYDHIIESINSKLLDKFLLIIKSRLLNLHTNFAYTDKDVTSLENLFIYLKEDRRGMQLDKWGGLLTLRRKQKQLSVSLFHTDKNRKKVGIFSRKIMREKSELLRQAWIEIFLEPTVTQVSFNASLCSLFGIRNVDGDFTSIDFVASDSLLVPQSMDYFRAARMELAKSFQTDVPYYLHFSYLHDLIADREFNLPKKLFHTDKERMYYIQKGKRYTANGKIDLRRNVPKIIFIAGSFVQYSLFGSEQQQILNFFPLHKEDDTAICHRFKNPIIFKISPGSVFHIRLLDENLEPLKADVGIPTLLTLGKTHQENMFPVTIISSDKKNMQLYPENRNNFFKNKLSFPLLFSDRESWTVSLRSMAFPKVKNIYPEQCKIMVMKTDSETAIHISVESSYITGIVDLLSLLNSTIIKNIGNEEQIPSFDLKSGVVHLKTNSYNCYLEGDMMKILGLSYSYHNRKEQFAAGTIVIGVMEPNILFFQPQEIIVISNIVEEAFYAQSRPTILRIVPILDQSQFIGYNYVQFEEHDNVPIKLDRVHDIEIKILTRKGDYVDFVQTEDVKIQLEFKIHH